MPPSPEENNELHESVKRAERYVKIAQKEGERSVGQNLALIGSLGWLVMVPTLVGIFIGRWLDGRADSGIFWTGGCIIIGVSLGSMLVWKRLKGEGK